MSCRENEEWIENFAEAFEEKFGRMPTDEEIEKAMQEAEDKAFSIAEAESTGN